MGFHTELTDALAEDRDAVVEVLAKYSVVPVELEDSEFQTSSLMGGSSNPVFEFERREGASGDEQGKLVDRQRKGSLIDTLGIRTTEDCEQVVEEIESHDEWAANA